MRSQLKIIITKIINHIWSLNQKMDNEKNATQEDESWGEYTKIDKDNKPVSKEQREKEKRHWNKKNIEEATRKINKEIYEHDKQASIIIKLDDLSIMINTKISRRGIHRGFVNIQEDLNKNILNIEKIILQAYSESNAETKYNLLIEAKKIMKIQLWGDIRFLMINKAISPGEITELIRRQKEIDKDIERWIASIS